MKTEADVRKALKTLEEAVNTMKNRSTPLTFTNVTLTLPILYALKWVMDADGGDLFNKFVEQVEHLNMTVN